MNTFRVIIASLIGLVAWAAPSLAEESLGGLSLDEVSPRIVTPNGDGLNDLIFFRFSDSIVGVPIETEVVDINGGKISELHTKSGMDDVLTWDGKDAGGRDVSSGIY